MSRMVGSIHFLKPTQEQSIRDLPASGAAPLKISCTGEYTAQVALHIDSAFHFTFAESEVEALARIADDATRGGYPAGATSFETNANENLDLYIRSQGSASIDGVSVNAYNFG